MILLYEAPHPTALSHSIPCLSLHIIIYLFFEYFANGSWKVAGTLQSISFNTLGDLSLVYCNFFILKRGCVQKEEIWKAFSITELPALLPLSAPFNLVMFFYYQLAQTLETLPVTSRTQILGFKLPLLIFLKAGLMLMHPVIPVSLELALKVCIRGKFQR